ncbi:Vps62-related protein [Nonomuraea fuscirosea]|nr:Vps62-related protein [Nonomuraea fuscirosea]
MPDAGRQSCPAGLSGSFSGVTLGFGYLGEGGSTMAMVLGDVEVAFTTTFTFRWSDENSGAHRDGGFWHPLPPRGFHALGSLGCPSYDDPNGEVVAVCVRQAADRPAARAGPVDYRWIYDSTETGSATSGSIWRPVPPSGYAPLGDVCVAGFDKPGPSQVVCVRTDLTTPGSTSVIVWHTEGSGGTFQASMAQISAPARADGQAKAVIAPGSFVTYVPHTPSPAMNGETQILRLPPLPGPWPVMPPPLALPGAGGTQVGRALETNRGSPRADRRSIPVAADGRLLVIGGDDEPC